MYDCARSRSLILLTGLLLAGCGGGDDMTPAPPPQPTVSIGGDWLTTYTQVSDTCGITLPAFDESGAKFFSPPGVGYFYVRSPWGNCDYYDTANTVRTGNKLTSSMSTLEPSDGVCTLKHTASVEYNFTENAYTGTEQHTFTYSSGDCGNFTSCKWVAKIDATRCDQCEVGCSCCGPSVDWPVVH